MEWNIRFCFSIHQMRDIGIVSIRAIMNNTAMKIYV